MKDPRVVWLRLASFDTDDDEPSEALSNWLDERAEYHDKLGTLQGWFYSYEYDDGLQAAIHLIFALAVVAYVDVTDIKGSLLADVYHP